MQIRVLHCVYPQFDGGPPVGGGTSTAREAVAIKASAKASFWDGARRCWPACWDASIQAF